MTYKAPRFKHKLVNDYNSWDYSWIDKNKDISFNYPLDKLLGIDNNSIDNLENEFWIDTTFLIENDMLFLKTLFNRQFSKEILSGITAQMDEEDFWQELYLETVKLLMNYNPEKGAKITTYLIWAFGKKIPKLINTILYNKYGMSTYWKTELRDKSFKYFNEKERLEPKYIISIEHDMKESTYDGDGIFFKEEELAIEYEEQTLEEKIKDEISLMIPEYAIKYGEKTMQRFEVWYYWDKSIKSYVKEGNDKLELRERKLFKVILEELTKEVSKRFKKELLEEKYL